MIATTQIYYEYARGVHRWDGPDVFNVPIGLHVVGRRRQVRSRDDVELGKNFGPKQVASWNMINTLDNTVEPLSDSLFSFKFDSSSTTLLISTHQSAKVVFLDCDLSNQ